MVDPLGLPIDLLVSLCGPCASGFHFANPSTIVLVPVLKPLSDQPLLGGLRSPVQWQASLVVLMELALDQQRRYLESQLRVHGESTTVDGII